MAAKKSSATNTAKKTAKKAASLEQSAAKKTAKAPAKQSAAKKTAKAPALKTATKKSSKVTPKKAANAPALKTPTKKTSKVTPKKTANATTAKKATAVTTAAAKSPARKAGSRSTDRLAVRDGEKPWTAAELKGVRTTLEHDRDRLKLEISAAEEDISHLLRQGGEGAGNDQADVGSNTFERDHEMNLAKNARANLELVESAFVRIDRGNYGICESCGEPIGKMRLQAFPRATLCMECKQRQERR